MIHAALAFMVLPDSRPLKLLTSNVNILEPCDDIEELIPFVAYNISLPLMPCLDSCGASEGCSSSEIAKMLAELISQGKCGAKCHCGSQ
jgi:hypothetical protein